jgi:hypothetical protein
MKTNQNDKINFFIRTAYKSNNINISCYNYRILIINARGQVMPAKYMRTLNLCFKHNIDVLMFDYSSYDNIYLYITDVGGEYSYTHIKKNTKKIKNKKDQKNYRSHHNLNMVNTI